MSLSHKISESGLYSDLGKRPTVLKRKKQNQEEKPVSFSTKEFFDRIRTNYLVISECFIWSVMLKRKI